MAGGDRRASARHLGLHSLVIMRENILAHAKFHRRTPEIETRRKHNQEGRAGKVQTITVIRATWLQCVTEKECRRQAKRPYHPVFACSRNSRTRTRCAQHDVLRSHKQPMLQACCTESRKLLVNRRKSAETQGKPKTRLGWPGSTQNADII